MSLLDDVSIVVTPNGYKAGELYAVIPVPTEGAEEITNGDFATDSDWSKATGVTISGGNAIFNNSTANNNGIYQGTVFQANTQYKITAEVSNYSSGNVTAWSGGSQNINSNESFTGNGTKTWIISTGASNGYILLSSATTNGNFNIDNVSVKEYTSADMDVTRETDATRVDENGLIEDVLANVPRIDYTGGGCPHILAEPQRTNLVTDSEDFTQWGTVGSPIISSNYGISPDGTLNADRVQMETGDRLTFSINTTNVSFSVYAKSNDGLSHTVSMRDGGGAVAYNMVVTNEWQRFDVYLNTTMTNVQFRSFEDDVDILMWGAQLEVGSYATSYIPTSGSTVTRNQDIFTRDGIGSLINSEEGVLFVEIAALSDDLTRRKITISDGTSSNFCSLYFDSISNKIIGRTTVGGVLQSFLTTTSYTEINFNKIAFKWRLNDFALWVNGTEVAVDTSGVTWGSGVLTEISFDNGVGGELFYGKVKQLQVYDTILEEEQLIALTT